MTRQLTSQLTGHQLTSQATYRSVAPESPGEVALQSPGDRVSSPYQEVSGGKTSGRDDEDTLIFQDDDDPRGEEGSPSWKVIVVDDDVEVHEVTQLALESFRFEGRALNILSAYSGREARHLIEQNPDTALVLADAVMETNDAGLKLAKYIREVLGNKLVRIVMRTGQPGEAPEMSVILEYDINDYKTKLELTQEKLFTTAIAALRSYRDLIALEQSRAELASANETLQSFNQNLEQLVKSRTQELEEKNQLLQREISIGKASQKGRERAEGALRLIVEGTAAKTGDAFFRSCVRYLAEVLQVRYALVGARATAIAQESDSRPNVSANVSADTNADTNPNTSANNNPNTNPNTNTNTNTSANTKIKTLAFWQGEGFGDNFEYDLADLPDGEAILKGNICDYPCLPDLVRSNIGQNAYPNWPIAVAESYVGMPLTDSGNHVIGHLAVMDVRPMARDSARELILKIFADRAGAELERKKAEDDLKKSKEDADAANRAKSEFLSKMSHELRTPLNAILGFTQVINHNLKRGTEALRSPSALEEMREQVRIINRSGEHLLELINDVLQMSKIESGLTALTDRVFDLHRLLDSLEEMLALKANSKGLKLAFDRATDVHQYIQTDESKLRQVLLNLLGNAIKFTQSGQVTLRVRLGRQKESGPSLFFEIEDTGAGIAPEEMNLLFEAFGQTETGRESGQGTGLGLPISREFVRLMGGDITVSSQLAGGSTFAFDIQVGVAKAAEVPAPPPKRKAIALAPGQPEYRILVVEDVRVNRLLLVKMLTSVGFQVREATNGLEALELWESWEPHLIWMDMRMPVMDGYEATKQIKAHLKGEATAIVALTASAFDEDRSIILSAGCDDFVSKPLQEEVILAKMAEHLGVRYLYEEEEPTPPEPADSSANTPEPAALRSALETMPPEWVARVYQAALKGFDDLILQLVEQIPSDRALLAATLTDWAYNFYFDRVINLIDKTD